MCIRDRIENVKDFTELGPAAFRKVGVGGPQHTITFFAPSMMEDCCEQEKMREPQGRTDFSEDDKEEEEDLEMKMDSREIEKMVELDETTYTNKMSVKELQVACKERQLPYSGSKRRLLDRFIAFKINLENSMKLDIASELYQKQPRKPLALGQPKLPSLKEQERHFAMLLVLLRRQRRISMRRSQIWERM